LLQQRVLDFGFCQRKRGLLLLAIKSLFNRGTFYYYYV
jgi:hypothetical protein